MKYYIKNIDEFTQADREEFLKYLDKEKMNEFKNATNEARKNSILFSQGYAKEIISKEFNIKKEDLIFSVTQQGKPYSKSHKNIHFSLSHSKNMLALGIDTSPIGIDIEHIRKADEKLIDRVCSENERKLIFSSENPDKVFTEIWTRKEAFLKALGTGIDRELKKVDTTDEKLSFLTNTQNGFIFSVFSL